MTGRKGAPQSMRSADDVASMLDRLKEDGFEFESNTSGKKVIIQLPCTSEIRRLID